MAEPSGGAYSMDLRGNLGPTDHHLPRAGWFARWLGATLLRLGGWTLIGEAPVGPRKVVLIAAPHTSNWDYVWMLSAAGALGLRLHAVGKQSLLFFPLGILLRHLGLIGVDRSGGLGVVEQLAERVRAAERIALAIPPSGTRSHTDRWRSGFYWVARSAEVPILMGFLDYGQRRLGLGPLLEPTGDVAADMDVIRDFYTPFQGKFPDQVSTIRLREEVEAS